MVKSAERKRVSLANKKPGGNMSAGQRVARVEKWKVKKHLLTVNEPVKVLMKFGSKGEKKWFTLDEIWEPAHINTLVPAWKQYCQGSRLTGDVAPSP